MDWTCPDCGRAFARAHQRHTCMRRTPEDFFGDDVRGLAIYRAVRDVVATLGPFDVSATRTQVTFRRRTGFAWLWLPGRALGPRHDEVVLTFDLPRHDPHARIKEGIEVRPGRFTHHLVVGSPDEVDADVRAWLAEAYRAAG